MSIAQGGPESQRARQRVKYAYAVLLFHLFEERTQEAVARCLVTLLDVTEGNGPAVLFGRHVAKKGGGVIDDVTGRYLRGSFGVLGGKIRVRLTQFRLKKASENPDRYGDDVERLGTWYLWQYSRHR